VIGLLVAATAAFGLILFVAFIASRLVRSRSKGISIRMQMFLAIAVHRRRRSPSASGVLVLDRDRGARDAARRESAASDQASAIAALRRERDGGRASRASTSWPVASGGARRGGTPELHLSIVDPGGRELFSRGPASPAPGHVVHDRAHRRAATRRSAVVRVVQADDPDPRRCSPDVAPAVLLSSIVLGIAAAIAAALIGREIAGPIEALTEFAVRVSEGERHAVPPPATGREVQRLSRAIDSMRRQLEGRPFVETFAADLSHELKNPVAAIRASAEVLADGALEEREEAARFVSRIQEATSRIEALLGDLLSLARIEARGVENAGRVDVASLVRDAARREREGGGTVSVTAPASAEVRGDASWIARAVENLVDNARSCTASTPESPVHVASWLAQRRAR
jgi:two-component system sensor histidine kinase CreC